MINIITYFTLCSVFLAIIFILNITIISNFGIGIFYLIYLIFSGNLFHFLEKRKLVKGDLVIINYRGKYRKAYIIDLVFYEGGKVRLEFEDAELNIKLVQFNWYPLSRIIIPKYLGKAGKMLFTKNGDYND